MDTSAVIGDVRLFAGLYDIREAARLINLPEQTYSRDYFSTAWNRMIEPR
jgi:hypothetical protein